MRSYGKYALRSVLLRVCLIAFRSALKVAEFDLSQAKSHVRQFQSISEANESALREFQGTHDEYKASTDAQIAKLEVDCMCFRVIFTS